MISASTVKLVRRFGDFVGILSILPLLFYVKFGYLYDSAQMLQQRAQQAKKAEQEQDQPNQHEKSKKNNSASAGGSGSVAGACSEDKSATTEAADSSTPAADVPTAAASDTAVAAKTNVLTCVPQVSSLLLLLLAEICGSPELFQPSDNHVKRAVGALARIKKKSKKGALALVEEIVDKIGQDDAYGLLRFTGAFSILCGLIVMLILHESDSAASEKSLNPFRLLTRTLFRLCRLCWAPRLWLVSMLMTSVAVGNMTALSKFIRRPATLELIHALERLIRALGLAGIVFGTEHKGPLPFWSALQGVAAVARAAHVFGYERVSWAKLLDLGFSGSGVGIVRGAFLMEAACIAMMLPILLRSRRPTLIFLLLSAPIVVLLVGGAHADRLEQRLALDIATPRVTVAFAVVCFTLLLFGGFPVMLSGVFLAQVFVWIHRLDKIRI